MHTASSTPTLQVSIFKPLAFCIVLGLLGALVNYQAISYIGNVHLILGNAAYIIVAMRLTASFSVLSAVIAVAPFWFLWGHPYAFITFGLEALFVATLRQRGWYVFFADIVYWLFIGVPLTGMFIWQVLEQPMNYLIFASLKQAINGLLYASIACFIIFFTRKHLNFGQYQQPVFSRGIRSQMIYAILLITSFTISSAAVLVSQRIIATEQLLVSKMLKDSTKNLADTAQIYVTSQMRALTLICEQIGQSQGIEQQQKILFQASQAFPNFAAQFIVDSQFHIIASNSLSADFNTQLPDTIIETAKQVLQDHKSRVTAVFNHRTQKQAAIITAIKNNQQLLLITFFNTNIIQQLSIEKYDDTALAIVVTDYQHNIVFASNDLPLSLVNQFNVNIDDKGLVEPRLFIDTHQRTGYLFQHQKIFDGWHIYVLIDENILIDNIEQQFIGIATILIATLLLAGILTAGFSRRLTKPLRFISKQIRRYTEQGNSELVPLDMEATREIALIYDELLVNKRKVREYQADLENRVLLRTQALKKANDKLKEMAMKDGLTNVFNRHYLDEQFSIYRKTLERNQATLAVIMLDIDHFKKINDNYGHLIGDICLKQVAQLTSHQFARETDMLVRFGGEEFLLLVAQVDFQWLNNALNELRQKIADKAFIDHVGNEFHVTVSFGGVLAPASMSKKLQDWEQLADECLYQAKATGRNKVILKDLTQPAPNEHEKQA